MRASRGVHSARVFSNVRQMESLPAEPCESSRSGASRVAITLVADRAILSTMMTPDGLRFLDEPLIEGRGE